MPYGVNGWVEILWDWTLEEEIQQWCSFINLNRFCFYGDEVTNRLFGLTKRPCKNPYFADRGVPKDCSKHVAEEVKSNEKFIKQYGEGNFGHTWATWSEIKPCLAELKQARDLPRWMPIFTLLQELCSERTNPHRMILQPEWIRFVVWGNW